ncbi:SNF2 family DNA or RNA helicase [Neomicrococcus lactis]|uniref:SNF2 family DNA or RNA helicase n=1 Tax=Neomicrococcus lactis TaxID=732241 RepID=A0A7W8YBW0_9MICC|nr:SNF2 family DNA or RNA helicase [Neomicrococcus lactis]
MTERSAAQLNVGPGSVVRVRDEDWLVTSTSATGSGTLIKVQGLSELVRDTEAAFYSDLDEIHVVDPRNAKIVADDSPNYRKSRLFLETTLRKTPVPAAQNSLTVSTRMLSKQLEYQRIAVAKALDPKNIRPRILIADAVGLGKTLEIGMILSELVARGRGENILIVTPRHVLEQMQHEMWSRFALPFVRLDSVGIQRVRQTIPASRNPFTYFKRAIISIDTLKTPRYREHLKKRRWDAVVIDESHNLTNAGTLNNELARILAPRTDALILASATPHNGKKESFAELVRLLDPTAVRPDGSIDQDAVQQLIVRRHRYSPEVAAEVGSDWAERPEPKNKLVPAGPAENAVATELSRTWIHPHGGSPATNPLFGWTLAKAFLSSPAALIETIENRLSKKGRVDGKKGATEDTNPLGAKEADALETLLDLAKKSNATTSAKFNALVEHLKQAGVGKGQSTRAVVFAERVATLKYLQKHLPDSLGLKAENIGLLHGGLTDVEQQEMVEQFKRGSSPLRVLVTGDVASEGVNLHAECHLLVHFDIPWSLIRIEQRNGRIDRYGQHHPPQIATLILDPEDSNFSGDIRVLTRLIEKEHEAHKVFSDVATLMGKNSVEAEEKAIRDALAAGTDAEDVIPEIVDFELDELEQLLKGLAGSKNDAAAPVPAKVQVDQRIDLYPTELDFLQEALEEAFGDPFQKVGWKYDDKYGVASLNPTPDLKKRLRFLPQDYLKERGVMEQLKLSTTVSSGQQSLDAARKSEDTNWPSTHYLGPLHPVLDWASDRALASISRNEVLAIRGDVDEPVYLMLGTISNRRGQLLNRTFVKVQYGFSGGLPDLSAFLKEVGLIGKPSNAGPVDVTAVQEDFENAVNQAELYLQQQRGMLINDSERRLAEWLERAEKWSAESKEVAQRAEVKERQDRVRAEQELAQDMRPEQMLVRPLLVIAPRTAPAPSYSAMPRPNEKKEA